MYSKKFYKRDGSSFTISVDEENSYLLDEYKWFLRNGYAARADKNKKSVYLHRIIMKRQLKRREKKYGKSPKISFKDGNKLNCVKDNIVFVKNKKRKRKKTKLTSKYVGISFNSAKMMWRAKITRNKKVLFDDFFETEKSAFFALNAAKKSINNKIKEGELDKVRNIKIEEWDGPTKNRKRKNKRSKNLISEKTYESEEFNDYFDRYFKSSEASSS